MRALITSVLLLCLGLPAGAQDKSKPAAVKPVSVSPSTPTKSVEVAQQVSLAEGKSTVLRVATPIERISVGSSTIADIILLNPTEVYMLGKEVGSTNLIMWSKDAVATVMDITVRKETSSLQKQLGDLFPEERNIKVSAAGESLVLQGTVADAAVLDRVLALAGAFARKSGGSSSGGGGGGAGGGAGAAGAAEKNIVNMLSVEAAQQVMLEVKIAEISKSLIDKLGGAASLSRTDGGWTYGIFSDFLNTARGAAGGLRGANGNQLLIDAEKEDGLVKVLAEPNVMAISGQEGSFLAGGKIFIPVAVSNPTLAGVVTITLEEKEFGVGLKFTPTVLSGGRINLKVAPEVSELSKEGVGITGGGVNTTAIFPAFTTRRASTTVQLMDGQSFAIGGLIKNNATTNVKRFPVLGDIPILGALFRSTNFQTDKTELLFIVTPRLVKPLAANYKLPTDAYVQPTRKELMLDGKLEGENPTPRQPSAPKAAVQQENQVGFELK